MNKYVRCDHCGCAFYPEIVTEWKDDIEYKLFRCDYCGKAYMISAADEYLRKAIAQYVEYCKRGQGWSEEARNLKNEIERYRDKLYGKVV